MKAHRIEDVASPRDSMHRESSSANDPRVAAGLDEYLAELQSGYRPSRSEFLARHPEIAAELAQGLDVLDLLHSAAGGLRSGRPAASSSDVLPPETILGDYRLIQEVGRGGMGVVYEARQLSLERRVAVKILSVAGVLDPRRVQRFRVEAQAVAQLNHPHIVPIYAVGQERGVYFYAMQYVEGCTLADILENQLGRRPDGGCATTLFKEDEDCAASNDLDERLKGDSPDEYDSDFRLAPTEPLVEVTPYEGCDPFRAIARLGIQAAEGLEHAHSMGVLHRDIKPSNLLLDHRGNLWITDFGLARFQDESGLTLTGDLIGTLRYMAPELALGRRMSFDPRSDIYALGATLYELLTKRPVFSGRDRRELLRQITQDEPVPARRIDRSIPRDLETIVMKAMAKEPERRYSSRASWPTTSLATSTICRSRPGRRRPGSGSVGGPAGIGRP